MDNKIYDNVAIHEAGHFIMYLINCRDSFTLPQIKELFVSKRGYRGHIKTRPNTAPEIIANILNSEDLPREVKEWHLIQAKRELKFYLAGIASEIINMRFTDKCKKALVTFYKKEKKYADSDTNEAIKYNTVIGGQTINEGVLPLVGLLEETIKDIVLYWDKIVIVANLLESERLINEDKLTEIAEQIIPRYGND